jgi:cyclase
MHRSSIVASVISGAEQQVARVSERLLPDISPYLGSWRSPRDAPARCFHRWDAAPVAGVER